jgi:hypothetical protein
MPKNHNKEVDRDFGKAVIGGWHSLAKFTPMLSGLNVLD